MDLFLQVLPVTVSFKNLQFQEESGHPSIVNGYFSSRSVDDLYHDASGGNGQDLGILMDVLEDNFVDGRDFAGYKAAPPPWREGRAEWPIPIVFLTEETQEVVTPSISVLQIVEMEGQPNTGRITVTKGSEPNSASTVSGVP